ncbi:MAG: hypothetical protein JSS12_04310 [Verrucomicrobia bacterium]|nr:hypothetical protein [Verrucomicrobiota bacterium]
MSHTTQVSSSALEFNKQGIFALPEDTSETYYVRASALTPKLESHSVDMYDIHASWVDVEYSTEGLQPWEAGCMWYSDNSYPTIQLNPHFRDNERYLKIYHKDEILSHEYVHAARSVLNSSRFEEIFAFYTSKSPFRTYLGPIFEKPWESMAFVGVLFISVVTLYFWPVVVAALALFIRLNYRWWKWLSCKRHLDALLKKSSLPLMVRLTDEEVLLFSKLSPEAIASWIKVQGLNFRWQLLSAAYLG